jgi:hypothetical protein
MTYEFGNCVALSGFVWDLLPICYHGSLLAASFTGLQGIKSDLDERSCNSYTLKVSYILYFQRKTTVINFFIAFFRATSRARSAWVITGRLLSTLQAAAAVLPPEAGPDFRNLLSLNLSS